MQPTQKFKKTLLAGAFIIGAGNSFYASAGVFPVTAGAIPDVDAALVVGFTEMSWGAGVIGNKVGESCIMAGKTGVADSVMLWDQDQDGAEDPAASFGALTGNACVSGAAGTPMIIEIAGSTGSTVTISVPDVTGAGYTYTPTAESCVLDFDGGSDVLDTCVSLVGNTVTGIGMSGTQTDGGANGNTDEIPNASFGYAAMVGKTRMILAGSISINAEIAAGTVTADNITVVVTYE